MAKEEKDMAQKDGITFEIKGNDLKNVNKFCKQHKNCFHGAAGEQFVYSFLPTGLGLLTTVKCSCGQTLEIGDFMDYDSGGYDEEKCRVLTEEDHKNEAFEEAALQILQMKSPRLFRIGYQKEQSFDLIYAIAALGIASVADKRISKCILWQNERSVYGEKIDHYQGLDEAGKISVFFQYFEDHVRGELRKYDCKNKNLLNALENKNFM